MGQETHSPSQGRINEILQLREDKLNGIYSGIPLWESFPTLGDIIPTIDKGQVILDAAASGIGKSMITRYKDIIAPWLFVRRHPELEIDLKFVIFLLEDDKARLEYYFISILLFLKFRIEVSPKQLKSSFKEQISPDVLVKIEAIRPALDDLLSRCIIEDSIYNATGIYKKCRLLSEEWGIHYYTDLFSKEGNPEHTITKSEYHDLKELPKIYKDNSIDELKNKFNIDPYQYRDFYKYSHYIPNNKKQHVIAIVDNINCLVPEKNETLKDSMDKFMYGYARKNIAKHWQWTLVAVQQFVGGSEEQEFTSRGASIIEKLAPSLDKLGDSKLTQRACHLIYGLFDPSRYGIDSYMGYNTGFIKDRTRFLFILKNNDGKCNKVVPLFFAGGASYFEELPDPSIINYNKYK